MKTNDYPQKRQLTGAFLRVKRDDKFEAIDVADLTREELEKHFLSCSTEECTGWIVMLVESMREMAEYFDITKIKESDEN